MLKRISLAAAIIGIIALAFLSLNLEPKVMKISEITDKNMGSFVRISGEVTYAKKGDITYFDVNDSTEEMRVVLFDKADISKGDRVEVIGKVEEYRGSLEVNADKVKVMG